MTPSVVVGMQKGELLRPYTSHLSAAVIRTINDRVEENDSSIFGTAREVINSQLMPSFLERGVRQIEVFGVWEDLCVTSTINHAIKYGISVIVPKGYTVRMKDGNLPNDLDKAALIGLNIPQYLKIREFLHAYREEKNYHCFDAVKCTP